jgi:hypothetical protein
MRPPDFTLDDRAVRDRELDFQPAQWLRALGAADAERDQAAVRQHQLLVRIARKEVYGRSAKTPRPGTSGSIPARP